MRDLRQLIASSLIMLVGCLLHAITPPFFMGMRPDFAIVMLVLAIILYPTAQMSLSAGLIVGIFTALSTVFPGGQMANIVDKLLTSQFIMFLICALRPVKIPAVFKIVLLTTWATLFSGAVFLSVVFISFDLPASFFMLYANVVLPAVLFNSILAALIRLVVNSSWFPNGW